MGGFSVRSGEPLPVDVVMRFRFSTPNGSWETALTARSVYSFATSATADATPRFLSGFKFVNPEAANVQARIQALVDHATSLVTFS